MLARDTTRTGRSISYGHLTDASVATGDGAGDPAWEVELAAGVARSLALNALTLGTYSGYELGSAAWAGYEEGGLLGALNAVNPLYQIGQGAADTALAIDRGDYRAAGAAGKKTVLLAAAAVFGTGRGLTALAEESAVAVGAAREGVPTVRVPSVRFPETAGHIRDAQALGHPSTLTSDGRATSGAVTRELLMGVLAEWFMLLTNKAEDNALEARLGYL